MSVSIFISLISNLMVWGAVCIKLKHSMVQLTSYDLDLAQLGTAQT